MPFSCNPGTSRTVGQTNDRFAISISRVSLLTRDEKNRDSPRMSRFGIDHCWICDPVQLIARELIIVQIFMFRFDILLEYLIVILVRFVLLVLLFNFVMHCIISTAVVAFEINYLSISLQVSNYDIFAKLSQLDFCKPTCLPPYCLLIMSLQETGEKMTSTATIRQPTLHVTST